MLDRVLLFMGRTVRMIIGAVIDLSIIFYVKLYMNEFGKAAFRQLQLGVLPRHPN